MKNSKFFSLFYKTFYVIYLNFEVKVNQKIKLLFSFFFSFLLIDLASQLYAGKSKNCSKKTNQTITLQMSSINQHHFIDEVFEIGRAHV